MSRPEPAPVPEPPQAVDGRTDFPKSKTGSQARRGPTPMMAQYLRIKAEHQDAILLFRMGDFYETFYDDARAVSEILGLTLTSREKQGGAPIPLAGIPYHALEQYLSRLLAAGRTVAICEQTEEPSQSKGLVRREVVEVLSPGTVTNPALLSGADGIYLLAIAPGPDDRWGWALLDGSTGEFRCGEDRQAAAFGWSKRVRVGELILPESWAQESGERRLRNEIGELNVTQVSDVLFESNFASECLREHFRVHGLKGLGLDEQDAAARAAGAALRYLADRQRARPAQVQELLIDRPAQRLHLDAETVAHLELFEGLRSQQRDSTLLRQLDRCSTPMGRRMLASWLRAPLCEPVAIDQRLDAVQWLLDNPTKLSRSCELLRGIGDLQRIAGRIATSRALPHELGNLRHGLRRVDPLLETLEGSQGPVLQGLGTVAPAVQIVAEQLGAALVEAPPTHLRDGEIFVDGYDEELDRLRGLHRDGKKWLASYQETERQRTGIAMLKVGYNRVFGYYLEITNKHLDKVPSDYEEKQRLAGGKRYVTVALKEREQEVLGAREAQIRREAELHGELVVRLQATLDQLSAGIESLATLDVLCGLASVARQRGYTRPIVDDSDVLDIEQGRHAVVERIAGEPFVPNDLRLVPAERQILLLTGPNMGGKSTFLRQAALVVIMAQMGSFVPAGRARIGVVDRLFTRVGASDNLARGQSTFLVEMAETANILRHATARSLVIFDEVGRGTSTQDGLALAWAITEYLHDGPVRPKTLFATHFHELTALAEKLSRAANVHMQVKEWENEILFLHRVLSGPSDRSYGVHVAELAGVPRKVIERAMELLDAELEPRPPLRQPSDQPPRQTTLFKSSREQLLERISSLDVDEMRPLDALQILAELVEELRKPS